MNILFGCYGQAASSQAMGATQAKFDGVIRELYQVQPHYTSMEGGFVGYTRGESSIVAGTGQSGPATAVLVGNPHGPWPDGREQAASAEEVATILASQFIQKKEAYLDTLNGPYATALVDEATHRLFIATDPAGARFIFTLQANGSYYFSTNMNLLSTVLADAVELNAELQDFFLVHGFFPFRQTPFANIGMLPPGTIHAFGGAAPANTEAPDQSASMEPKPATYAINYNAGWHSKFTAHDWSTTSIDDAVELLHEAFLTAFNEQIPKNEKRIAVLLGGFDSALVAAALVEMGKEVETFSFYYEQEDFNQPHTDTLAQFAGIKHNWIKIDELVIDQGIDRYARTFNFPTNWLNYVVQTEYVCGKIAEAGFRYVFSGDGCDHIFLGYPKTHTTAMLLKALPRLPKFLIGLALLPLRPAFIERWIGRPYIIVVNLLRSLGRRNPAKGLLTFRVMDIFTLRHLKKGRVNTKVEPILEKVAEPFRGLSPDRLAYTGKGMLSPNKCKIIGSVDHHGLVVNAPYMHPGFKKMVSAMPDALMRPPKTEAKDVHEAGKYVLMQMALRKKMLPPEVIYQKKVAAVNAPVDDWYYGPLRQSILTRLRKLPFGYNRKFLNSLLRPTWFANLYKNKLASDQITTHIPSLLLTYNSFTSAWQEARGELGPNEEQTP